MVGFGINIPLSRRHELFPANFNPFRVLAKAAYYLRHVCPSVCPLYQFGSHQTDFHEIWYWRFYIKFYRETRTLHEELKSPYERFLRVNWYQAR
jgi:hypothetical protein